MPAALDFGARTVGMRVNRVIPGTSAERVGLKAGDAIVRINGKTMPAGMDLADVLEDVPPGSHIDLLVARDNLPVELSGTYEPTMQPAPPRQLFSRGGASGRVDLARAGNTVTAVSRGVAAFTLLLSPDQFDFDKAVKVVANGRTVFDGRVRRSLRTLLTQAAADNDRTMLFGAELRIRLDR
jgi:membrane-associated protease RseP (regulator of RpoE activity)